MLDVKNAYVVGVTGDWHQDLAWAQTVLETYFEYGVTHIHQLGDFGFELDNHGRKFLFKVNQILEKNNQTLYVTLGNHENYTHFLKNAVPSDIAEGWLTVQHYDRVLFAARGARAVFDGVSFVSLGGANSIDRQSRVEGFSWWREEQISSFDVTATTKGGPGDVMLTHDCPVEVDIFDGQISTAGADWTLSEIAYADLSRMKVSEAVKAVQPKIHFHGHMHLFKDSVTPLDTPTGKYDLHSVSVNMNRTKDNMLLFSLESLTYEIIPPSLSAMKLVRRGH